MFSITQLLRQGARVLDSLIPVFTTELYFIVFSKNILNTNQNKEECHFSIRTYLENEKFESLSYALLKVFIHNRWVSKSQNTLIC